MIFRPAFAVLFCLAVSQQGAIAGDRAADRAAIAKTKVETWRALYYNADVAGLDAFLRDDFVMVGPDGSVTPKAEELASLAESGWNGPEDFLYTVEDIIFVSDKAAIVYGHGNSTRTTPDGGVCHHTYWSSNTLVKESGDWRPVFSHVSGVRCVPVE